MNSNSELVQKNVRTEWARIEAQLKRLGAKNTFHGPASDEQLAELEQKLSMQLPLSIRTHLKCHNGCVDYFDQIVTGTPFLSAEEIHRDWKINCEVDEDSAKEIEGADLDGVWWHERLIPVSGSDGDCICVDSKTLKVYSHDHGMGGVDFGGEAASSLESWLANIADRLEHGDGEIEDGKVVLELG